jgi:hypothetical protein
MALNSVRPLIQISDRFTIRRPVRSAEQVITIKHPLPSTSRISPPNTTDKLSSMTLTVNGYDSLATRIARDFSSVTAKLSGAFFFTAMIFVLGILPVPLMAQVPGSFNLSSVIPRCSPSGQVPGVRLNWTASAGATSYQIFRDGSAFGNSNDTSYESYNNFTAGQTYSFFIRARNAAGLTQDSNTVSLTMPSEGDDRGL